MTQQKKPELTQGMRIAGAAGGVVVGALAGAIALAVAGMAGEILHFAAKIPSALAGGLWGAGIGLALGLCFPEKAAMAVGELISTL